jgi:hypothetical protein
MLVGALCGWPARRWQAGPAELLLRRRRPLCPARCAQVFGMVWAGSQVTKLARAGAALACAPLVDRGLDWLASLLKLRGKREAFFVVLAGCVVLALALFGGVVLLHA